MPEFDDVLLAAHYRPLLDYNPMSSIERYSVLLKDGETTATIYPIQSPNDLPPGLLTFLCDEFNIEIERGDTFAFFNALHVDAFLNYWFGAFAGVMVLSDARTLSGPKLWEKECLGTFFIKPNYPGRASHVCTGGFLVNAGIRGKGIGRTLADCFLQWAPRLGYTYCVFNLVFETNVAARRIWESLNFKRIGRIKSAGILKGHETAVDAIIYGRELLAVLDSSLGAYRFDKIKLYLETGKYPAMADRQEKSRLRSSASHYRLEKGKLMLRDKEVVLDPVQQLQICTEVHLSNHGGINKTTSAVAEKYHWTRIKDTATAAIRGCVTCRDSIKDDSLAKRGTPAKKLPGSDIHHSMALHHLPSQDADGLLLHELNLYDGLMAVEAVKRPARAENAPMHRLTQSRPLGFPSTQNCASSGVSAVAGTSHAGHFYLNQFLNTLSSKYAAKTRNARDGVPVDPDVSAFDHNVNPDGDEIAIAQALLQSNDERRARRTPPKEGEES
ncbi:hypothetical protein METBISCDRAFT_17459 [Metschnikowia bicuspidata]|uniref:N-acetyltransferase domain-containing protein n=1 Tax=Metschnikowia bicuspidata TaxID=27322 RepID=A0A4P9ZB00_9ASCO|nr:hypothetical protein METBISCDRAFT_17459 [Metschnikowia bicuspidata]